MTFITFAPVPPLEQTRALASTTTVLSLLPTQAAALAELESMAALASFTFVAAAPGMGMTTILQQFAHTYGGLFVDRADKLPAWRIGERALRDNLSVAQFMKRLEETDLLVIEDICMLGLESRMGGYPILLHELFRRAEASGKRIVMGHSRAVPISRHRDFARWLEWGELGTVDLQAFLARHYGEAALGDTDFDVIERYVASYSIYALQRLVQRLGPDADLSTRVIVDLLQDIRGGTNVRVEEVEPLDFATLPGTDHIARALETHVILPFEHPELARELDIKAKRGVLLFGPPGTGKTSIGRALAHRMKGRFFLIDGSIPTEPPSKFFDQVKAIIEQAKRHAPSVIFIDDADVLFGIVHVTGLARYLLTLLDGMESERIGKVCIMMTAMNANKIPQPILRSGRVELWLSTKTPDLETRAAMLARWLGSDLPGSDTLDLAAIAALAEGTTPADLRRVVADAKALHAADHMAGAPIASAQLYLERALAALIATRDRMAHHLRDESLRVGALRTSSRVIGTGAPV
jgi:transitional endoplasmic reticulum ATPase